MNLVRQVFYDRLEEINAYLELLSSFESSFFDDALKTSDVFLKISPMQQRIASASVYLQLYNLVESTVNKCIEALCNAISKEERWTLSDLSKELRQEWVRNFAQTHLDLNYDNRLHRSVLMCEHLIQALPVEINWVDKGGGGNWDDEVIYNFSKRIGCVLKIDKNSLSAIKRPLRDDCGALVLIRKLRNELAHGNISFGECGEGVTVSDLSDLSRKISDYLEGVLLSFEFFIGTYAFLCPDSRPNKDLK